MQQFSAEAVGPHEAAQCVKLLGNSLTELRMVGTGGETVPSAIGNIIQFGNLPGAKSGSGEAFSLPVAFRPTAKSGTLLPLRLLLLKRV